MLNKLRITWILKSTLAMWPLILSGCAGLLPHARQEAEIPWHSYAEAEAMFEKIIPGTTTLAELKALGVDPVQTPNVAILGHADLLRRLAATSDSIPIDPPLQQCVIAYKTCFGYEIEQRHLDHNRIGNFWLDILNFRREVDVLGWEFDAIVVIEGNKVIYKLWSGKPSIRRHESEHNPLGPLQGLGPSLLHR